MHGIDLKCVIVQKLIYSRNAKGWYCVAPQRKGIGSIDLRGINTVRDMHRLWKEYIGLCGKFSLLGRDSKKLKKCIAIIRVTKDNIYFMDKRCALYAVFRRYKKDKAAEEDMEI